MDHRTWRLPGPAGYVEGLAEAVQAGRHAFAVLPEFLLDDETFAESLVLELQRELRAREQASLRIDDVSTSPRVMAEQLVGEPCGSFGELVAHPEVAGRVAVLVAASDAMTGVEELPSFLDEVRRATLEVDRAERLTLLVLAGPSLASGTGWLDRGEVGVESHWWWNRVARSDVAAHVERLLVPGGEPRLISQMRCEILVELSRGDLDLAERLASAWRDDLEELDVLMKDLGANPAAVGLESLDFDALEPPRSADARGAWDRGAIGAWDGRVEHLGVLLRSEARGRRRIWRGQARVLMPALEEYRQRAQDLLAMVLVGATVVAARTSTATHRPRMSGDDYRIDDALDRLEAMWARLCAGEPLPLASVADDLRALEATFPAR